MYLLYLNSCKIIYLKLPSYIVLYCFDEQKKISKKKRQMKFFVNFRPPFDFLNFNELLSFKFDAKISSAG